LPDGRRIPARFVAKTGKASSLDEGLRDRRASARGLRREEVASCRDAGYRRVCSLRK
jgi:hypothetical protein